MRSLIRAGVFSLAQLLVVVDSSPAHAAFVQILSGPIDRVVAARKHIAVIREDEVIVLREDGNSMRHIAEAPGTRARAGGPDGRRATEHMLDLLDVAEIDRGTDFADELVDNEQTWAQRRFAKKTAEHSSSAPLPMALVANDADIWIVREDVRRISSNGSIDLAWGREGFRAPAAVSASALAVAKAGELVFLDLQTNARTVEPVSDVRKVAISKSAARQSWATDTTIRWNGPGGTRSVAASTTTDLRFCDELLVAVVGDALVLVSSDGGAHQRAAQPGARRLLCSSDDPTAPWLLLADDLWASVDRGAHWQGLERPAAAQLVDVAASDHRLWLATADGLYASSDEATAPAPSHSPSPRRTTRLQGARVFSWLPTISLRAGANVAQDRREWEALAFAAFPLDGRSLPVVHAAAVDDLPVQGAPETQPLRPAADLRELADLRDPNQECLRLARRKAIELALAEPERARSYISRAGYAAWLPELRLLVSRRYGRSESIDVNSSSTALSSPLGIDTVNDVRYEARATWDLSKLVFSSEELAAQAQAMHMAELRRDIETTMNRLYFERRSLDRAGDQSARRTSRRSEIEAELDALSGGAFATCVGDKAGGR